MTDKKVLSVDECARMLSLSRNAAYRGARTGAIPSIRVGKRILIPVAALEKMLEGAGLAPAPLENQLLAVAEVAKRLQVSQETVRRYIWEGRLKASALPGGYYRIEERALRAMMHLPKRCPQRRKRRRDTLVPDREREA